MLQRSDDLVDVLFDGDECVALTREQCLRLAAVPSAALAYLASPRRAHSLQRHLEDLFGPAPEGSFEAMVDELIATRILVRSDTTQSDRA